MNISQSVGEQMSDITCALKAQEAKREQRADDLIQYINKECDGLADLITSERQSRIEHHNAMYKMLDDIYEGLKTEIITEKKQRELTEESILKLLEETTKRVEHSLHD